MTGDQLEGEREPRRERWVPLVVVAALIVSGLALVIVMGRTGMGSIPREERRALVERTVSELQEVCGPGRPEALRDHCRELASFAAQFEECQGECEALTRRELTPAPTR